jgi:hypothetical protein
MKTAALLVAISSCAVLMRGTCVAEPPSNPASEQVPSENRQRTIDPKSASVDVDLRQNKAVNNRTFRVRSPAIDPFTKLSPKNLRSHGPNPATIGGPANRFKNPAAINGTGMKRKP